MARGVEGPLCTRKQTKPLNWQRLGAVTQAQFQPAEAFSADRILSGHRGLAYLSILARSPMGRKRQFRSDLRWRPFCDGKRSLSFNAALAAAAQSAVIILAPLTAPLRRDGLVRDVWRTGCCGQPAVLKDPNKSDGLVFAIGRGARCRTRPPQPKAARPASTALRLPAFDGDGHAFFWPTGATSFLS